MHGRLMCWLVCVLLCVGVFCSFFVFSTGRMFWFSQRIFVGPLIPSEHMVFRFVWGLNMMAKINVYSKELRDENVRPSMFY